MVAVELVEAKVLQQSQELLVLVVALVVQVKVEQLAVQVLL
jgi:hypothetical protein